MAGPDVGLADFLLGTSKPSRRAAPPPKAPQNEDDLASFLLGPGGESQDIGTPKGDLRRRDTDLQKLETEGVDITTGLDAATRAGVSLREFTPGRARGFLEDKFGATNVRNTPAGFVIRLPTVEDGVVEGKEILLDEKGLSLGDFADMADAGIVAGGAITAILAFPGLLAGGILSLAGVAVIAGVAGQTAAGIKDITIALNEGGFGPNELSDIVAERGINAAIDTVLDFLTGGTARLGGKIVKTARGPFAGAGDPVVQQVVKEAGERTGLPMTGADITGSSTLARGEAIARKVPGAATPFEKLDAEAAMRGREIVDEVAPNAPAPDVVGQQVSDVISAKETGVRATIESRLIDVENRALESIGGIGRNIHPDKVDLSTGGRGVREAVIRERDLARQTDSGNFEPIVNHPEALEPIVKVGSLVKRALELRREFPTETVRVEKEILPARGKGQLGQPLRPLTRQETKQQASQAFLLPEAKRFLGGLSKLDDMSLQQAIRARTVVNGFIAGGQALSEVGDGILKQVSKELTEAIEKATTKIKDSQLKADLVEANRFHKEEVLKFNEPGLNKLFRQPGQGGFLEDADIISKFFLRNNLEELKRIGAVVGVASPEFRAGRKAAFDHMLVQSQDLLNDKLMDPKRFFSQLNKLDAEGRAILFGSPQKANAVIKAARQLAVRHGKVDLSVLRGDRGEIARMLRRADQLETQAKSDFDNTVIKPLVKGELDASALRPEDFTRHLLDKGSLAQIEKVFELIGPRSALATDIRKSVVMDILQRSRRADEETLAVFLGQGEVFGRDLRKVLTEGLGDQGVTGKKLRFILGDDTYDILLDVGIVQEAKGIKRDAAKAAGGLIAGSILSSLAQGGVSALPAIIKYRIVGSLLTFAPTRKWLGSITRTKNASNLTRAAIITSPQFTRAISNEFDEEPDLMNFILEELQTIGRGAQ